MSFSPPTCLANSCAFWRWGIEFRSASFRTRIVALIRQLIMHGL